MKETQREEAHYALSLLSVVLRETLYISYGDRFAAQIVYLAILSAIALATAEAPSGAEADFCGGALPAYVPVSDSSFLSFQFMV